jgi:beta-1,4-N-acetylglucosaminyltransferase
MARINPSCFKEEKTNIIHYAVVWLETGSLSSLKENVNQEHCSKSSGGGSNSKSILAHLIMVLKSVVITVGTTKFDDLIDFLNANACELCEVLRGQGITSITLQYGNSIEPTNFTNLSKVIFGEDNVQVFKFKSLLSQLFTSETLLISHAGAGTIMEGLRSGATMFVVINERLMDNHQLEIAERLARDGYLAWSKCANLLDVLQKEYSRTWAPLPAPNTANFLRAMKTRLN